MHMDSMSNMVEDISKGMDPSSSGLSHHDNTRIAQTYWCITATVVALFGLRNLSRWAMILWCTRQMRRQPDAVPSRPRRWWHRISATVTALFREASYSQFLFFNGRVTTHFSFMPMGRWLLLACYWGMLLSMLWTDALLQLDDPLYPYNREKVAIRAAWVSVTQVPLIFCLSAKFNVITLLTGISYERLQWFHRWAARTLMLTVIVHWSFFYREWSLAGIVRLEFERMPMVKYGFGSWAIVVWTVLTSIGLIRNLSYEFFVIQHLAAAAIFIWAIYTHVPLYARYNVWMAIGFLALDWICRGFRIAFNNLFTVSEDSIVSWTFGHRAAIEALPDGFTRVTVRGVAFSWRAGQHIYLSAPSVGAIEAHPFTIANERDPQDPHRLTLLFKAHSGFTRRVFKLAQRKSTDPLHVFLHGPFGWPPDLRVHETLVFVSSGSGAAFTVPLLENAARNESCIRTVNFWWIVRRAPHLRWFYGQIEAAIECLRRRGVMAQAHFVVTGRRRAFCSLHASGTRVSTMRRRHSTGERQGEGSAESRPPAAGASNSTGLLLGGYDAGPSTAVAQNPTASTPSAPSDSSSQARTNRDLSRARAPGEVGADLELNAPAAIEHTTVPSNVPTDARVRSGHCICRLLRDSTQSSEALEKSAFTDPEADIPTSVSAPAPASQGHSSQATTSDRQSSSSDPPLAHASAAYSEGSGSTPPLHPSRISLSLHCPRTRPDMDILIRPSVERAWGSTAVVVCGGAQLVADARTYVAKLSDERAVHKGTGAQGIYLWTEKGDW